MAESEQETARRRDGQTASGVDAGCTRLTPAVVGLAVAALIVAAALAIGARSGWDSIGSGGINRSLLPKVGEVAPDFETEDVFGNPVRLSQFRGQPVWLMFWGSWCPPCRAEFPHFRRQARKLRGGVAFLGVNSNDNDAAARKFLREKPVPYPSYRDPEQEVASVFGGRAAFPTTAFYDSKGSLAYLKQGGYSSERKLSQDIDRHAR